jgi:uncharacterized protein YbaP (TraB family)
MKLFICLLFVFGGLFSYGQDNSVKSGLLWEISGNNIPKGSYLFGTMHIIESDFFIFPKKLQKKIEKSGIVIMELAGVPNQLEALNYLELSEGTFFDFFTKQQEDSIINWAIQELKMTENGFRNSFSKMKPFVVSQLATQIYFIGKTESYEVEIERIASDNKIEIKGLETIEEQIALFDGLSNEDLSEMVMEVIRHPKEGIQETKKMMEVYSHQNIDELYQLIIEDNSELNGQKEALIDNRNLKWIPEIESTISNKSTFIAVGAGHLGGNNGVIQLLRNKGYTLKPIQL